MAIVVQEVPELTRREELELEVAGMIEEVVTSDEQVSPWALAGIILDLIEVETGISFD
jgi:hypothetical protein